MLKNHSSNIYVWNITIDHWILLKAIQNELKDAGQIVSAGISSWVLGNLLNLCVLNEFHFHLTSSGPSDTNDISLTD